MWMTLKAPPEFWTPQCQVETQISFWVPGSMQKDFSRGLEWMGWEAEDAMGWGPQQQMLEGQRLRPKTSKMNCASVDTGKVSSWPSFVRLLWTIFPTSPLPCFCPAQCSQRILLSHPHPWYLVKLLIPPLWCIHPWPPFARILLVSLVGIPHPWRVLLVIFPPRPAPWL